MAKMMPSAEMESIMEKELQTNNGLSIALSKPRQVLMLLAVFLTNIATMGEYIIYPVTNTFYSAFPDSVGAVNFIISGPQLMLVIFCILTPFLIKCIGSKKALTLGCILFTIGGVFGVSVMNVAYIIVFRLITSIGMAIINVTATVVLTEIFIDEKKRGMFLGFYSTAMSAIGVILSNVSGILAAIEWTHAYWCYASGILVTVLVILFVPQVNSVEREAEIAVEERSAKKESLGFHFWFFFIALIVYYGMSGSISYFNSIYIAENSLGTEALAGLAASLGTLFGALCGLVYGMIFNKAKTLTGTIAFSTTALALILMAFVPTKSALLAANILMGGGMTIGFTYALSYLPAVAPKSKMSFALSMVQVASGVGMFLITYFMTFLKTLFHTELITPVYVVPAVMMVVVAVLVFVVRKRDAFDFE